MKLHYQQVREHCKSIINGELVDLFDKTNICKSIDFAQTARNNQQIEYNIVSSNEHIHKYDTPKNYEKMPYNPSLAFRHKRNLSTRIHKATHHRELIIIKSGIAYKISSTTTQPQLSKPIPKVVLKGNWSNFICIS